MKVERPVLKVTVDSAGKVAGLATVGGGLDRGTLIMVHPGERAAVIPKARA